MLLLWSVGGLWFAAAGRGCLRVYVCENWRVVFASVAGWCLLREVGDPGIIKETQAER